MNYWMTTHWPPHENESSDHVSAGVWVPDGRQKAAVDFAPGDWVLIYHPRSGRTIVEEIADGSLVHHKCQEGREGVVGVGRALTKVAADNTIKPERYTDGTELWWRWHAKLQIVISTGFVSRKATCKALGYKENYNLRGFGDGHSGLKKISETKFEEILCLYRTNVINIPSPEISSPHPRFGGGNGESDEHINLKDYIASQASLVFDEEGLQHVKTEFPFPTGDRADIVLRDRFGRIVGVEIEVDVHKADFTGTLQAIKYRWMLELMHGSKHGESRAALVAYSIHDSVQKLSNKYGVECFEVSRATVEKWLSSTKTG